MIDRRAFLGAAASAAVLAMAPEATALGRTPLGGKVTLHVPWAVSWLDPHDPRDPLAAIFAGAIADSIFALEANGTPYPTLAAAMPARENGETVVRLREGLRTARLVPLDARDLVHSVERARGRGAEAATAEIPRAVPHKTDPLAVVFKGIDPHHLARLLASPLLALLPRKFSPTSPDGTGAFRADASAAGLMLTRNLSAARGPAFLDAVEVLPGDGLSASLRAFEAERDDVGWLGLGLHDPRKGAVRFDFGRVAWVVLVVSADAGAASASGGAQRLCDAIPSEKLAHLALGAGPAAGGDPGWTGPSVDLLVDEGAPHLLEVARAVGPILSRPGHEVTVAPVPRGELLRRKVKGKAWLSIEIVRPAGPSPAQWLASLAGAEDPARARELASAPPKLANGASPRSLTSGLRAGVLGEVRVAGGAVADLMLARAAEGWDLGASFRRTPRR